VSPDVPLGPPKLMMSFTRKADIPPIDRLVCPSLKSMNFFIPIPTLFVKREGDGQLDPEKLRKRDEHLGVSTAAKREYRKGYLPDYEKAQGSDAWEVEGKVPQVKMVDRELVHPF
jgi:hypothetical protein